MNKNFRFFCIATQVIYLKQYLISFYQVYDKSKKVQTNIILVRNHQHALTKYNENNKKLNKNVEKRLLLFLYFERNPWCNRVFPTLLLLKPINHSFQVMKSFSRPAQIYIMMFKLLIN